MTKEIKFLREINISYRKKPVATDAPIDVPLTDPGKVFELFADMQNELKEKLIAISLDAQQKIISYELVAIGTVHSITVNPFELFRSSIVVGAVGMILVHNHPSGDPTPTASDRDLTRKVADYGRDGGISLIDHIIIGDGRFYSFMAEKEYQC
jgi:DNA repair protein RadC